MARSGARVTVIDNAGRVLADSEVDSESTENHLDEAEIQQAFASGEGQSVRRSTTLGRDLVYRAVRYQTASGSPVVIRMRLPLAEADASLRATFGEVFMRLLS